MLTPTHHHTLWDLNGSEMSMFLKYQCEKPLPAGHIGEGQHWQSHTPLYPHLAGSGAWTVHKAKLHNFGSERHPLFTHYLDNLLNSCNLSLSELFIILVLSAWADQFLLLGTFLWRRAEFSTNSQALFKLLNWWGPWADFSNRLRRMVFGAENLHGVSFSRNVILWIVNLKRLVFPSTCLHLFSPSSRRLTLK